jgi:hypothetical protein
MSTLDTLQSDFLEQDETAVQLKICGRTFDRWRRLGEGPPSRARALGERVVNMVYRHGKKVTSTAEDANTGGTKPGFDARGGLR